ncbi:MAG: hypothetical protein IKF37_02535 [Bacilli bacterium]|nr:hypothetical protein [Bacilli bacterium]
MFFLEDIVGGEGIDFENFSCASDLLPIFAAAKFVIRVIQIAVPFALVIWGSLDFFKALIAGDEKEMKMKRKPFISRLVAAIVILILPWLVELIAGQVAGNADKANFWTCYKQAKAKIDFTCWHNPDGPGCSEDAKNLDE